MKSWMIGLACVTLIVGMAAEGCTRTVSNAGYRDPLVDQLYQQAVQSAQGTRQAITVATATAEAIHYQEMLKATNVAQAELRAWSATVTAAAPIATATAIAQATQTALEVERQEAEIALMYAGATATIQAASALSTATAQQQSYAATATAVAFTQAVVAQRRAASRAQAWEDLKFWGLVVVIVGAAIVFFLQAVSLVARQDRQQTGDGHILQTGIVAKWAGLFVVDPSRMTTPVLQGGLNGVTAPPVTDPETQERQNQRADYVRLASHMGRGSAPQGSSAGAGFGPPALTIIPPDRIPELVPRPALALAEAEWQKGNGE